MRNIARDIQLLADLDSLLQVSKSVLVLALLQIGGADVAQAQGLVGLIPRVALNLQGLLKHLQRFVRLTPFQVEIAQVVERVAGFFLGTNVLPDLEGIVISLQSGVGFSQRELHFRDFFQARRHSALLPQALVDGHRVLIVAQGLCGFAH